MRIEKLFCRSNAEARRSGLPLLVAVLLVVLSAVLPLPSQDSTPSVSGDSLVRRETVIQRIVVHENGDTLTVPPDKWNDVIVARGDTIAFYYWCDNNGGERDPFLFRTILQMGNGLPMAQDYNRTPRAYWDLPENSYTFSVFAFGRPADWQTEPKSVRFQVSDSLAEQWKSAYLRPAPVDTATVDSTAGGVEAATDPSLLVLLLSICAVLVLGAIIWGLVRQARTGRNRQVSGADGHREPPAQETTPTGVSVMRSNSNSREELLAINSALRAEIASLRGQIDALQARTAGLQKANRELMSNQESLLQSKHQLEELQSQKDDLFAMVVHDIKNPAGIIKGLVELLRSYDLTAMEQQEVMQDLLDTSGKILALAQEVSRVLALESGSLTLDVGRYPIAEVVRDVCRRNDRIAQNKDIRIAIDLAADIPDVEIDAPKIEEVLDNLISNAIKFSHKGALVQVATKRMGSRFHVSVKDNGLGLSEEDVKKAFRKGTTLSARPTANESSSGLGLWIVKRIVEAHKGRVWVKSSLGNGATFAFELPLVHSQTESTPAEH